MKKLDIIYKTKKNIFRNIANAGIILVLSILSFSCSSSGNQKTMTDQCVSMLVMAPSKEKIELKESNTEEYDMINENPFLSALQNPLSTFSIDVDKAAYSNIRRFLDGNELPPKDAVRIEEMINYFSYNYPQPTDKHPFSINTETAVCPWNKEHLLLHIGLQGKKLDYEHLKPSNLVFLLDVSGSMEDENKLPLVKKSMEIMVKNLQPTDQVSIAVYAGAAGIILTPTPVSEKDKILDALNSLNAGGSTAGGEGIELAYDIALKNLFKNGNNRVVLCTDGDFNVGTSSTSELVRIIQEKRKQGIYLTICGFGMGNYKDGRLEQISNAGNGNYFYIDNYQEAEKVFSRELRANLFTIAKDVKIQVEFNPSLVKGYRLIGYENRMMKNEEFNDDLKDAGELGAGHTVTALYEIVPISASTKIPDTDSLKYQKTTISVQSNTNEMVTIKFRYKPIDSESSNLITNAVTNDKQNFENSSENFRFSAAVAAFGMLLRDSEFKGNTTFNMIKNILDKTHNDNDVDKNEFVQLVEKAEELSKQSNNPE
jgi:Ca-activated chloride channel homolog